MNSTEHRTFTLGEIAEKLRGDLEGPTDKTIHGVRSIDQAGQDHITVLRDPQYSKLLSTSKAGAVVMHRTNDGMLAAVDGKSTIRVKAPHMAFAELLELFYPRAQPDPGISAAAHVDETAEIDPSSTVCAQAHVGPGVRVGAHTVISAGVVLGDGVEIGTDCYVHPNVVIYDRCSIGDRVILHAGVVIGADGFGFVQESVDDNPSEPVIHHKILQVGTVVIEDDVEIGANSTVDRATLAETRVCHGTKIDNLVQVGHNCFVGEHSILVAQVGLGGSSTLGRYVTLAGQSGVASHVTIGEGCFVGAKSGVTRSIRAGMSVWDIPARDVRRVRRAKACMLKLPKLFLRVRELEKKLARLEGSDGKDTEN